MKLSESQREVASDIHRFRVLNAGRRWGKTHLAVEEIKGKAVAKPCRIAYFATTYAQARDIAWELLRKEMLPITIGHNESRLELRVHTVQGGESLITLRGWENVDTARGQAFDFLVMDEVASMRNFWVPWREVLLPTLTDRSGEVLFISTPKGFNHWYDLYNLQEKDSDFKSFHYTTYDNPYIKDTEIEKLKRQMTDDAFSQEYLADFHKTEGLVYKEFDREKHVISPEKVQEKLGKSYVWSEHMLGIDFGFTNPTAIMGIYRDSADNYYVLDEYYERGKTDIEVAEYVAAQRANRVYCDPAAPASITELRRRGVNVRDVVKGKDSVKNGIDVVRKPAACR